MSYAGPPPSTLSDVIAYIRAVYVQAGLLRSVSTDPTTGIEWLDGERYRGQEGAPPRITFEETAPSGSNIGPPIEIGGRQSASLTETVVCRVWGADTTADGDRYRAAKAMAMQLLDAFICTAEGRIFGAQILREDQTNIETFGEEYQLVLSYKWAVPYDNTIRLAAEALGRTSGLPDPDRGNGATTLTFPSPTATLANARSS